MAFKLSLLVVVLLSLECIFVEAIPVDDDYMHPVYSNEPPPKHRPSYQNHARKRDWNSLAQAELQRALNLDPIIAEAKNVILFLGDGMGVSTVSAARFYLKQSRGVPDDEEPSFSWENFPNVALSKTYNVDRQVPDSAGTATAFLCGEKANYYTVGVNQNVPLNNCTSVKGNEIKSILKHSIDEGKWTGVVTTTRITHATPAASYAASANRNWEHEIPANIQDGDQCTDIASQLIEDAHAKNIRVIFGGGRARFIPDNETDSEPNVFPNVNGRRKDGKNLIKAWEDEKTERGIPEKEFTFVKNKDEFDNLDAGDTQYVLGLFNPDHLDYEHDRINKSKVREPSLAEMVEKAVSILKKGAKGYFLLVEGGRIDHGHHDNYAFRALNDTVAFADAVDKAATLTNEEDTLLVVTADHSHVFTMGGYPTIDNDIFGVTDGDSNEYIIDNKPYLTLSYGTGPGYLWHRTVNGTFESGERPRRNLTGEDTSSPTYQQDTAIPNTSESHGGEDVAIYASGPMSHLFHGVHQQNYIAHVMMYASCVGPNKNHCSQPPRYPSCPEPSAAVLWKSSIFLTLSFSLFCRVLMY